MTSLLQKCQQKGIKITHQRKLVIYILENSEDHPDVDELFARALEKDSSISIATIYRTVKVLEDAKLIDKKDFGEGKSRYEIAGKHHEHLIDVDTGDVIEIYNDELEKLKIKIASDLGYELINHKLELYGKKTKKLN